MTVHLAYEAHIVRLDDLHREAAERRRSRGLARRRPRLRQLLAARRPRSPGRSTRSAHEPA
jgi:hypothetical protein